MKKLAVLLGLVLMTAAAYAQTPAVTSVVNGATYSFAPLPNSPIARGAIFIVFGNNLGPLTLQGAPSLPLPTNLGGTSIRVTSGSFNQQAPLLYVSANQLAGIIPSGTPVGTANLTVTVNASTSSAFSFQVVQSNFGAFTQNQAGSGAGILFAGDGSSITPLNSARPGQTVVLYGTGLGPITTDDAAAPAQGDMTSVPVEVYVGATKVTSIQYRGRTGGFAGLDQINFTIPAGNANLGCTVGVLVKINNLVSNPFSIAISNNGGPCSDPNGLNFGQLTSRDSLAIGSVFLTHTSSTITLPAPIGPQTSTTDSGSGYFVRVPRTSLTQSQASFNSISVGGCVVSFFSGQSAAQAVFNAATGLDAGAQLTVTGPTGSRTLPKVAQSPGLYGGALSIPPAGPFLGSGTFTVNAPGGADVGSFNASIQGNPLTWTNSSLPAIDRTRDLLITWTGGQNANTIITGSSTTPVGNSAVGASFYCLAPGSAQQFSVPAAVLLLLPPSSQQGAPGFTVPTGSLLVGSYTINAINPPPSGLDQAFSGYTDLTGVAQSYQ